MKEFDFIQRTTVPLNGLEQESNENLIHAFKSLLQFLVRGWFGAQQRQEWRNHREIKETTAGVPTRWKLGLRW